MTGMLRNIMVLLFSLYLPLGIVAQSQGMEIGLKIGASFPAGDFAAGGSAGGGGTRGGFAEPGFTMGGEISFPVMKNSNLYWMNVISYHNHQTNYSTIFPPYLYNVTSGSWHILTPLTGLKYRMRFARDFAAYGFAQGGYMYGISPELQLSSAQGTGTQETAEGGSFAYSVGMGVFISDLVDLTFRYVHGDPTYEVTTSTSGEPTVTSFQQNTTMIQLVGGLTF